MVIIYNLHFWAFCRSYFLMYEKVMVINTKANTFINWTLLYRDVYHTLSLDDLRSQDRK